MADQDQASTEPTPGRVLDPVPVTPSRETERPAGLAFDVEKGVDLPGVPARRPDCPRTRAPHGAGDQGAAWA